MKDQDKARPNHPISFPRQKMKIQILKNWKGKPDKILRMTFTESYSFSSPKVWNELPMYIRCDTKIDVFKTKLKTFYFKKAFNV